MELVDQFEFRNFDSAVLCPLFLDGEAAPARAEIAPDKIDKFRFLC